MQPVSEGISCPVCERVIVVHDKSNQESLLDAHVTRCLRQSTKRNRPNSSSSSTKRDDEYSERWDSEPSSDDISRGSGRDEELDISDEDSLSSSLEQSSQKDLNAPTDETNREPTPLVIRQKMRRKVKDLKDDLNDEGYRRRLLSLNIQEESFRTDFGSWGYRPTWDKLYEHQKKGCAFLWTLYKENSGGILADEMGLGEQAASLNCFVHTPVIIRKNCPTLCAPLRDLQRYYRPKW
jgi:SNF2 family DNA or RNA helicase